MKLVVVETPFAADEPWKRAMHRDYLAACLRDCYGRGEAPFASHAIGPLALDDNVPQERDTGIQAGLLWGRRADLRAVYTDLGTSTGMWLAVDDSLQHGPPHEMRSLMPEGQWREEWMHRFTRIPPKDRFSMGYEKYLLSLPEEKRKWLMRNDR